MKLESAIGAAVIWQSVLLAIIAAQPPPRPLVVNVRGEDRARRKEPRPTEVAVARSPPRQGAQRVANGQVGVRAGPPDAVFALDYEGATARELIHAFAKITRQRLMEGTRVRSIKATIRSPVLVTSDEAYHALLCLLDFMA